MNIHTCPLKAVDFGSVSEQWNRGKIHPIPCARPSSTQALQSEWMSFNALPDTLCDGVVCHPLWNRPPRLRGPDAVGSPVSSIDQDSQQAQGVLGSDPGGGQHEGMQGGEVPWRYTKEPFTDLAGSGASAVVLDLVPPSRPHPSKQ